MTTGKMQGKCLCGAVGVTANRNAEVEACHCGMCRRWGGGPLLAIHCGSEVQFTGQEQLGVYDCSEWTERGFCRQCGTQLAYRFQLANTDVVPAGLVEKQDDLSLHEQIFIDSKPGYYAFANDTPVLTEAEVLKRYGVE